MQAISEDSIRERAYKIWEREGRPHGRDYEHWVQARVELIAEATVVERPRNTMQASTSAPKPAVAKSGRQLRPAARAKKQA